MYNRDGARMNERPVISNWFFIGVLLVLYGFLIMGAGMWELFFPPARTVVLAEMRMNIWWGVLLLLIGGFYAGRFAPW
jgi:hypothetical protein